MKQRIQLNEHFTYGLFRFAFPSIIMMIFTSVYGVVDGLFVSNYVGKTAFASVNLIMPFIICTGAIGFMLGTGGSAIVGKTLGGGDREKANRYFSMLVYATIALGVLIAILGLVAVKPVARLFRCGRRAAGRLCDLRFDFACVSAVFYAAIGISELFATAEKNIRRPVGNSGRGINQHLAGFCFCRDFALGNLGRRAGNGYKRGCRRRNSRRLFFGKNGSLLRLTKTRFTEKFFSRFAETARRNFLPTFPPQ